jgi:hypothetical protein
VDFSLDDLRKSVKREKKIDYLKQKKKDEDKTAGKIRRKENKEENKKKKVIEKGKSIDDITDINTLIKLFSSSISRGKKQRIKKKLVKLGYNPQYLPKAFNEKIPKGEEVVKAKSNYVATKLDFGNQNLNKNVADKKEVKQFRNKEKPKNKFKAPVNNEEADDYSDADDIVKN